MILIITHKEDYTADYLIDKLNNKGISYHRFNCEDCLKQNISLQFGEIEMKAIHQIHKFDSVWYRRTKLPELEGACPEEKIYLLHEIDTFLFNLFAIIKGKWLSHPESIRRAENKFYQLSLARESGFHVPNTIITTDRSVLKEFFKQNDQTVVKPISKGRINYSDNTSKLIFTNIVSRSIFAELDNFELTPAIFQEHIDKDYEIRVTVVGENVFGAVVYSQTDMDTVVDWRRKKLQFLKYDVPEDLRNKCIGMLKALGISFGAFDFIRSKSGKYYFLEVNPNGQWVWIENDTRQPISESIINFLSC
jgi:glutathione synthase/RimK-type ligase-like ATP-grasp enzyme